MGVMRRLTSLSRTGTRPVWATAAEVNVGMPRSMSARVPAAGAVGEVTGTAAAWGPVDGGAGAAEVLRRRGVEGKEECGRRAARATRAMEDGILTQLVVYGGPIPLNQPRGAPENSTE